MGGDHLGPNDQVLAVQRGEQRSMLKLRDYCDLQIARKTGANLLPFHAQQIVLNIQNMQPLWRQPRSPSCMPLSTGSSRLPCNPSSAPVPCTSSSAGVRSPLAANGDRCSREEGSNMHSSRGTQLSGALRHRELFGSKIATRPFLADFQSEEQGGGCILNNPGLSWSSPAFACEYSKVYNNGKFLAVADEEGFISIMDTEAPLPRSTSDEEEPKPRAQWLAHKNAVFDIAWAKNDTWMLAASGDQTVSLWDTGLAELLGTFRGHTGSVKSVCAQPGCNEVFASGGRDGVLMVWDARVPAVAEGNEGGFHKPVATVQDAHASDEKKRRRSGRTPLQGRTKPSVTSLLFSDACTLATGGVDGVLKVWDLRQLSTPAARAQPPSCAQLAQLCSAPLPSTGIKQHGITSLALHPNGVELLVSLTGGHHMMYQLHRPHIGPTKLFGGHTVASFYVKAAFSPDGSHILSGSSDRKAYIWQVDAADGTPPYMLEGHEGEVTAVAWCPSDLEQVATTADDATLRVWSVRRRDWAVREVPDALQGLDGMGLSLGLRHSYRTSPVVEPPSALGGDAAATASPESAGRLSHPHTPQVPPSAHRTPRAVAVPGYATTARRSDAENARSNCNMGSAALGSPAAAAAAASQQQLASSSARRPRSVAELHAALGSQAKPRRTKQASISAFLRSPPAPLVASPTSAQKAAGGAGAGASSGSGAEHGRARSIPLSPRLKRLRFNFDLHQQLGGGGGGNPAGRCPGADSSPQWGRDPFGTVLASDGPGEPASSSNDSGAAATAASKLQPRSCTALAAANRRVASPRAGAAVGKAGLGALSCGAPQQQEGEAEMQWEGLAAGKPALQLHSAQS